MTSITASRGVASITPPSSSHGNRDWEYSVPIDTPTEEGDAYYSLASRKPSSASRSRKGSLAKGKAVTEDVGKRTVSFSRSNSDFTKDIQRNAFTQATTNAGEYLAAPRAPALTRSNNGEAGDQSLDPYAANRLSTISGVTEILPNVNGSATAMYDLTGDIDNREASSWIHRDKLMRIENHEFRKSSPNPNDAWIKTAQRKLSVDRISKARGTAWEQQSGDDDSTSVFENDDCDLRLPEEREAELLTYKIVAARNKSTTPTKIPVNLSSPAPIPFEYLERNTPLKRPRSNSDDGNDALSISYPVTRIRSESLESEIPPVTPPEKKTQNTTNSITPPSKTGARNSGSKTQNSPRRPSSSHRTSAAATSSKATTKPRVASSAGHRTSGNSAAGAASSKHNQHVTPEGPPPWALGTYAPDPSLPQDQQLIPTVAKRLQQEQWEREGVSASVYDRELRPLKIHDTEGEPKEAINFGEQSTMWPLSQSEKQKTSPPMVEPTKPQEQSRPQVKEPIRVKDPEETPGKGKKEKGGCCGCTIM